MIRTVGLLVGTSLRQVDYWRAGAFLVLMGMMGLGTVPGVGMVWFLRTDVALVTADPEPELVEAVAEHHAGALAMLVDVRIVPEVADPSAWDAVITVPPEGLVAPVWEVQATADVLPGWTIVDSIVRQARLARVFPADERAALGLTPPFAWPSGFHVMWAGAPVFFAALWTFAFAGGGARSGTPASWGPLCFGVPRRAVWLADLVIAGVLWSVIALVVVGPTLAAPAVLGWMSPWRFLVLLGVPVVGALLGHALGTLGGPRWPRLLPFGMLLAGALAVPDWGVALYVGAAAILVASAYRSVAR